ncbi:MAG: type I glyceraldehyde-3-phosphate dehydrogenase, partial [Alphaproteobacteria bacterium]
KETRTGIDIGRGVIRVFSERDPTRLPWGALKVDVVVECTGSFTSKDGAAKHLEAGAGKVLVSAPATGADLTVVQGVNDHKLKRGHRIVSCASCTTNCLVPVVSVLHKLCGIAQGYMTTIHAYTGDQNTVDKNHRDFRRARAAAINIIPTSTGAARSVGLVMPELKGRLDGTAIRVPTPNVSLVDFSFNASRKVTVEGINKAMTAASRSPRLKGILEVNEEPLVSSDFNHTTASAIFDLTQTQVIGDRFARVLAWYDNEWGYSHRMVDVAAAMGRLKQARR